MIETLTNWAQSIIVALGYPGLALVMFLENVFPPIPSEVVLPLAGSLTIQGPFTLTGVVLVSAIGAVAGAWVFYGLGRWYDERRLRSLVQRYGKWFLLKESDFDRALAWFRRYGELTVFFGRMIPLVRSLISLPAGMAHMNVLRFTLYTALGSITWNLALALAGRLLGQGWALVSDVVDRFENVTVIILAILVVVFFAVRVFQRISMQMKQRGS